MKVLIKTKLSPHKSKTPEGYLICQDAIIARTGPQDYLKSEIYPGFDGEDEMVSVNRRAEEVFAPATLASFENKPLTCEHPDENVTPENYRDLAVGFVRDVRQGKSDKGEDVMLANLIVTDAEIIKDIEHDIRTDLSCGYDCDITDGEYPEQINIRGNHVALCEQGRAGIARIIDSEIVEDTESKTEDAADVIKTYDDNEFQVLISRGLYHENVDYWPHKGEEWVNVIEETDKAYHVHAIHTETSTHPEINKDFWVAKSLVEGTKKLKPKAALAEKKSDEKEEAEAKKEEEDSKPEAVKDSVTMSVDPLEILMQNLKADDYIDEDYALVAVFSDEEAADKAFENSIYRDFPKMKFVRPEATYLKFAKDRILEKYQREKKQALETEHTRRRKAFVEMINEELVRQHGPGILEAIRDYIIDSDGTISRVVLYTDDKAWREFYSWVADKKEHYGIHDLKSREEIDEELKALDIDTDFSESDAAVKKYLGLADAASNNFHKQAADIMKEQVANLSMQKDSESENSELDVDIRNAKAKLINTLQEQIENYTDKVEANAIKEEAKQTNFKAGPSARIRQWYAVQYPDEKEIVDKMNPDCTFKDLWDTLNKLEDVDRLLNIPSNDTKVKMLIFGELADMMHKDLDYVNKRYQMTIR